MSFPFSLTFRFKECDLLASTRPQSPRQASQELFAAVTWCRKKKKKGLSMSVVDDVLHLFRIVLDYFGVSPDMVSAHSPAPAQPAAAAAAAAASVQDD